MLGDDFVVRLKLRHLETEPVEDVSAQQGLPDSLLPAGCEGSLSGTGATAGLSFCADGWDTNSIIGLLGIRVTSFTSLGDFPREGFIGSLFLRSDCSGTLALALAPGPGLNTSFGCRCRELLPRADDRLSMDRLFSIFRGKSSAILASFELLCLDRAFSGLGIGAKRFSSFDLRAAEVCRGEKTSGLLLRSEEDGAAEFFDLDCSSTLCLFPLSGVASTSESADEYYGWGRAVAGGCCHRRVCPRLLSFRSVRLIGYLNLAHPRSFFSC